MANILPEESENLEQFWSARYESGKTGWDLGGVSPPLKHFIDIWKQENLHHRSLLLPGCGNAYEANYLLEEGYSSVTVVDIALPALEQLKRRVNDLHPHHMENLHLVHGDFFKMQGAFGLVLEQTFFCALDPSLRERYARKMHDLLQPEGELAGVFFDAPMYDHRPPFGGSAAEYKELLSPYFEFLVWESCQISHPARQGSELLFRLKKKG